MAIDEKLLDKARRAPHTMRFREFCRLVESLGFVHERTRGSHRIYSHPRAGELKDMFPLVNLQPAKSGSAKPYQVREVLERAKRLGII